MSCAKMYSRRVATRVTMWLHHYATSWRDVSAPFRTTLRELEACASSSQRLQQHGDAACASTSRSTPILWQSVPDTVVRGVPMQQTGARSGGGERLAVVADGVPARRRAHATSSAACGRKCTAPATGRQALKRGLPRCCRGVMKPAHDKRVCAPKHSILAVETDKTPGSMFLLTWLPTKSIGSTLTSP